MKDSSFLFTELEKDPDVSIYYSFIKRREYLKLRVPGCKVNDLIKLIMVSDFTVSCCKYNNYTDIAFVELYRSDDSIYSPDTGQNEDMYYKLRKACGLIL